MNNNHLRIAVATKDGVAINEHFGHAKVFYIYDVTADKVSYVEIRNVPHYCLGNHADRKAMPDILETIADCMAVFVAKIGDGPTEKLNARGIEAVTQYTWEEIIPSLADFACKYQKVKTLDKSTLITRYFISYSGITLPLKLVNEIKDDVEKRISYFIAYYSNNLLLKIEKMVYGEIEFTHDYSYDDCGKISRAIITEEDEEPRTMIFDEQGQSTEI